MIITPCRYTHEDLEIAAKVWRNAPTFRLREETWLAYCVIRDALNIKSVPGPKIKRKLRIGEVLQILEDEHT